MIGFPRKRITGAHNPQQILASVKKLMTGGSPQDARVAADDVFKLRADVEDFALSLKEAILANKNVTSTNLILFLDFLMNSKEHRPSAGKWLQLMTPHILEISKHIFSFDLLKLMFIATGNKWLKKRMFVGDVQAGLAEMVVEEEVPSTFKITGQKRARVPEAPAAAPVVAVPPPAAAQPKKKENDGEPPAKRQKTS